MAKYTPSWCWTPRSRNVEANCETCEFIDLHTTVHKVRQHLRKFPDHTVVMVSTLVTVIHRGVQVPIEDMPSDVEGDVCLTSPTR